MPAAHARRPSIRSRILLGSGLLATALLLVSFAAVWTGAVTVVATTGASMEPGMRHGDLVVVRPASTYQVGDVAAYRSHLLGSVVLHRIVDRDGENFVLQGDNNDFLDADRPTSNDMVGRPWFRIPAAGAVLTWVRQPVNAGALMAGAVVLVGAGTTRRARRSTTRSRQDRRQAAPRTRAWPPPLGLQALGGAGIALALIGAAAHATDSQRVVADDISFTHVGELTYDASVPRSAVYPDGLRTGDVVYRRITDRVDLRFDYRLEAPTPQVETTAVLTARLVATNGWARELELSPPASVRDHRTQVTAPLRLAELDAAAAEMAQLTGIAPGALQIEIEASVSSEGMISGRPIAEGFVAARRFALDDNQLRPTEPSGAFKTTTPGQLSASRVERAGIGPFGVEAPIDRIRLVLLPGLGMVILAGVLWSRTRATSRSESAEIAQRHGDLLLPVTRAVGADQTVIDVASFDALVRLARHHEQLILDHALPDAHVYRVDVAGTHYRYTATGAASSGS